MNIAEIKRDLEGRKARGGDVGDTAAIGLRLLSEVLRLNAEIAKRNQLTLFGDVLPPPKTPIGT